MSFQRRWMIGSLVALAFLFVLYWARTAPTRYKDEPGRIRGVVYGYRPGADLTLDVFKPAKPNGIGVLWMISGGWNSNRSKIDPNVARPFTDRGQTVFAIVHGSEPTFQLPAIVEDIHRAVRFVRVHATEYGVDPDRLGIIGASSGGHLSLMMAACGGPGDPKAADPIDRASSRVQAAAVFFPPTDFLNYGKPGQRALSYPPLSPFWHVFPVSPNSSEAEKDRVARTFSPVYGLSKEAPPIRIIHGDADTLVPIQQSQEVMEKLDVLHVPHDLIIRKDKAHGWPEMNRDVPLLADWFDTYLPAKPTAKSR